MQCKCGREPSLGEEGTDSSKDFRKPGSDESDFLTLIAKIETRQDRMFFRPKKFTTILWGSHFWPQILPATRLLEEPPNILKLKLSPRGRKTPRIRPFPRVLLVPCTCDRVELDLALRIAFSLLRRCRPVAAAIVVLTRLARE